MDTFHVVLFIHVLSAIALFMGVAFEGMILARVRTAQNRDELRQSVDTSRRLGAVYGPAFLGILVGGIYLAAKMHIREGWVPLALLATLLMGIISGAVTGRVMSRLRRALAQSDASAEGLLGAARSNSLVNSYGFRAGLAVGIVFLMTATPAFVPSIVALAIASALGIFFGLRFRRVTPSTGAWESARSEVTVRS